VRYATRVDGGSARKNTRVKNRLQRPVRRPDTKVVRPRLSIGYGAVGRCRRVTDADQGRVLASSCHARNYSVLPFFATRINRRMSILVRVRRTDSQKATTARPRRCLTPILRTGSGEAAGAG
jgi:hypothetical protein